MPYRSNDTPLPAETRGPQDLTASERLLLGVLHRTWLRRGRGLGMKCLKLHTVNSLYRLRLVLPDPADDRRITLSDKGHQLAEELGL